ncbi:DNA repair protein RecO [Ignatzschineria sp. LJL83]
MQDELILNRTEGVVLNKRPFKESGFLVDLFTRDYGRLTVFARGRANPKKPLSHLELFTYSAWYLKEGKAFYFIQEVDDLFAIRLSGREIWTAYYLNELLLRTFPKEQPSEELFDIYYRVLEALKSGKEIEPYLRQFESSLLADLGILPDLMFDAAGDEIILKKRYYLSYEEGLLPIEYPGTFQVSGKLLSKINDGEILEREDALTYRNMMRYLLAPLLGGKPLQSRVWMQKLYSKGKV